MAWLVSTDRGIFVSEEESRSLNISVGNHRTGFFALELSGFCSWMKHKAKEKGYSIMRHLIFAALIHMLIVQSEDTAFAQWQTTTGGANVLGFAKRGISIFAATAGNGVFLSTNDGVDWHRTNTGLTDTAVNAIAFSDTTLFVGTHAGVFASTDEGASWNLRSGSLIDVRSFATSGMNLFAANGAGVFTSTDGGAVWNGVNNGLAIGDVQVILLDGANLLAGTVTGGIFLSTDDGMSWFAVDQAAVVKGYYVTSLASSASHLFAGTYFGGGVFTSTDGGLSWAAAGEGLVNPNIYCLAASGSYLFAGTGNGGSVYLTVNNGKTWSRVSSGLPTGASVMSLIVSGVNVIAGTSGNGIWYRPLSQITSTPDMDADKLPTKYSLAQNYPNPFNPTTLIRYRIPEESKVVIQVYDVFGRVVSTLVKEKQQAGEHETEWNAGSFATGVYFYKLQTRDFSETKRMILMK